MHVNFLQQAECIYTCNYMARSKTHPSLKDGVPCPDADEFNCANTFTRPDSSKRHAKHSYKKKKIRTMQTQDLSESLPKKNRKELPAQEQRKSSAGELLLRKEALNHTD